MLLAIIRVLKIITAKLKGRIKWPHFSLMKFILMVKDYKSLLHKQYVDFHVVSQ
jgi:hypothetical protein